LRRRRMKIIVTAAFLTLLDLHTLTETAKAHFGV
jgi:hypothetical protein